MVTSDVTQLQEEQEEEEEEEPIKGLINSQLDTCNKQDWLYEPTCC